MSLFKVQYHLGLFAGWDGGTGERQPRAVLLLMWSIKALGINDQLLSHLHANRKSSTCMLLHYLVEIEANGNEYTRNKWRVQTAFCERVFVWQDNIAAGGCSRMARLAKLPSRSLRPRSFIHLSQSDLKVEQIVTVSGNRVWSLQRNPVLQAINTSN